ncbi:MAG: glycosyltransferase [Acidimicrobiales bacterium]
MLTQSHFRYTVVASAYDARQTEPMEGIAPNRWTSWCGAEVNYRGEKRRSLRDWRSIFKQKPFDLLYVNTVFDVEYGLLPLVASRLQRQRQPIVLAPRGQLMDGALAIRSWRKRAYLLAFRPLVPMNRITWHASNELEARSIRRLFGDGARVAIAPNLRMPSPAANRLTPPPERGVRAIFLSRISPKKNLLGALRALALTSIDIDLQIVGPVDDNRYWTEIEREIEGLPSNIRVTYVGPVPPDKVITHLEASDFLLFPTFGENYGHVIIESLSAGLPVIVGPNTPFSAYADDFAAVRVCDPHKIDSIATQVGQLVNELSEGRSGLTASAQDLAERHFAAAPTIQTNINLFETCLSA